MPPRVIAIDVETTGLSASRGGRIIEIGAVAVDESGNANEFQRGSVWHEQPCL